MIKKRAKHYVNGKDLYLAMVDYKEKVTKAKEEGTQLPMIPNYVGVCFMLICTKLATKPNFMGYSYKDEMIADGIENCVAAAHSFDPAKSNNPFAYFTQIAWNAFIRRIAKEKKQGYIKHKNFEQTNLLDDLLEESYIAGTKTHNEYSDEIIRSFEEKLVKQQKKSKQGIEKFAEEQPNEESTPSTS
jgi:Sigma-70 region 2